VKQNKFFILFQIPTKSLKISLFLQRNYLVAPSQAVVFIRFRHDDSNFPHLLKLQTLNLHRFDYL